MQKGRRDQRTRISYLNNNQTNNTEKNALPVFSLLISLLEPLEPAAVKPIIALDSLLCFALPACQLSFNICLWLLYMDQSYPLLWSRWKIALDVLPACEHSNNHQGKLQLNIPLSWQIQLVVHSLLLTIVVAFECICCAHTNSRQGGEVTQCVGESKHNACEQWWSPCNRHQVASLPAPFALQPFVNPDLHTHQNLTTQMTAKTPSCDLDFGAFHSPPVFMCLCLLHERGSGGWWCVLQSLEIEWVHRLHHWAELLRLWQCRELGLSCYGPCVLMNHVCPCKYEGTCVMLKKMPSQMEVAPWCYMWMDGMDHRSR